MKVLLFTTLTTLLLHTAALACSGIWGIGAPATMPTDGATGVPLDAKVTLIFPATHLDQFASQGGAVTPEDFVEIVLRPVGGEPIDGDVELVATLANSSLIFRPRSALAPNTTYEVLDRVREATVPSGFGGSIGDLAVRLKFTTGTTSIDVGPAEPPGPASVTYECCTNDCCFGTTFTITWPAEPNVYYSVERVTTADIALTAGNSVSGVIAGGPMFKAPHFLGDGTFEVRAFNITGLPHPTPSSVLVEDPCNGPTPGDDSISETPPDGAETAEVSAPTPGDDGCSTSPPSLLAALILAAQSIQRRYPCRVRLNARPKASA